MFRNRLTGELMENWVDGVSIIDGTGRLPPLRRLDHLPHEQRFLNTFTGAEQDFIIDHLARLMGPRGTTSNGRVAEFLADLLRVDPSDLAKRALSAMLVDPPACRDLIVYCRENPDMFLRVSRSGLPRLQDARRRW